MIQCPDVPPVDDPAASNVAGWIWVALAVGVLAIDWYLLHTHRPDLSQWIKKHIKHRWVWRILGGAIFGSLLWHLLFGGPFWTWKGATDVDD